MCNGCVCQGSQSSSSRRGPDPPRSVRLASPRLRSTRTRFISVSWLTGRCPAAGAHDAPFITELQPRSKRPSATRAGRAFPHRARTSILPRPRPYTRARAGTTTAITTTSTTTPPLVYYRSLLYYYLLPPSLLLLLPLLLLLYYTVAYGRSVYAHYHVAAGLPRLGTIIVIIIVARILAFRGATTVTAIRYFDLAPITTVQKNRSFEPLSSLICCSR